MATDHYIYVQDKMTIVVTVMEYGMLNRTR